MGNTILGKRSRSFYKGFNERQLDYIRQKFQMMSDKGNLSLKKFMESYKMNDQVAQKFFTEMDFNEDSNIDEYQFICIVHSLCSRTIEQLATMFYSICTKNREELNQKNLLNFTSICLEYNSYLQKNKITGADISKANRNKFQKYDFDKNNVIDRQQFIKICLKDEDYKKWMFNMGFITKKQLQFQDQIYQLVDSDIGEEISRHQTHTNSNVDKIKRGIQHRIEDDEFQVVNTVGEQSAPSERPWKKSIKGIQTIKEKMNPPSQFLTIDHIYGYRSFDCRDNVKYDSKGRIIYHQASVGIVLENKSGKTDLMEQSYLQEHQDDITCLDVCQDLVATGEVGTNPMVILWETNKKEGTLKQLLMITKPLEHSVGNVTISKSKKLLAVSCNDIDHKVTLFDINQLMKIRLTLTSTQTGVIATGPTTKNIIFDIKFSSDGGTLVAATLKDILFLTYDKGVLTTNRGIYQAFSVSPSFCLSSLNANYQKEDRNYILSGMGNGSVYFWEKEECKKAVCGHLGSVSAICERKDIASFISGDKSGLIIIWNIKFEKESTIKIPKSNSPSTMILSLCCNHEKQILIGTKSSDIFTIRIGDDISRVKKIMSGHSDAGSLNALAIHKTQPYFYTGGDDQRLIKWEYRNKKTNEKELRCPYKIKSIDISMSSIIAVGYVNGVVDCFGSDLEKKTHTYRQIKNPDQQVLNLVKFDASGTMLAVCYQYPSYKIIFLAVQQKDFKPIGEISLSNKILSLDFQKDSKYIRINTSDFDYIIYDITSIQGPKKIKASQMKNSVWNSHSVAFSPQTQGILTEGVTEEDIKCCERSPKYRDVFIIGDKYSKLKLFSYPAKENKIFNKYFAHSNEVTDVKFNANEQFVISIGGQQKSIIVWKYNAQRVTNEFLESNLQGEDDDDQEGTQINQKNIKKSKIKDQFQCEQEEGVQSLATKAYLGQIKKPSNFNERYNPKKNNTLPKQEIKMQHVFGIRNTYLKDEVRNQCRFSKNFREALFPTACLAVKMNIQDRVQTFYLEHKEDVVSFAIDPKRQVMATGQMAEKNAYNPRKKIVSIYVWDIEGQKTLNKLEGFHTIAIVLLQFSPNSQLLFSCGNDEKNTFAIYDWKSGSILYSGPVSRGKVNGIAWKNDQQFMTCGNDHVKFWTGNKGRQGEIKGKTEGMVCCVSSKSIYISGSGDGGLYNWVGEKTSSDKIKAHTGKVHCLIVKAKDDSLYSGGDDGKILKWRLQKNGQIKHSQAYFDTRNAFVEMLKNIAIPEEEFGVLSLDFSPQGEMLVATKGASLIYVSANNNKPVVFHQGHYKGQLWALSVRTGSQVIYTGGDDGTVRLWDIQSRREVSRVYFNTKIRGLDCSNDQDCKIVVGDSRAKIYLYNKNLTEKICEYTGKPYEFNQKQPLDPWIQDIKFSPDSKFIAYGCHGKSMYMEILKVQGRKIQMHNHFKAGTSALLHVDWSKDSSLLSTNTQAYELLFYGLDGKQVSASSTADVEWATWTQKFGFPVQGIFQGVDYTDVNSVCRDLTETLLAVGYDDQTIRLFKYPCYIPKQVSKQYYGHSSHVTRVKFTPRHLISIGGNDRSVIIWKVQNRENLMKRMAVSNAQESDGLQDLDEDVDLPLKAIKKKKKTEKIQEFFEAENEGDQFLAVKPWLGAIKQPTYEIPKQTIEAPKSTITLEYVHGYRCKDARQNLYFNDKNTLIYHAAAVLIYHKISENTQELLVYHNDDILSIDYHRKSGGVITGELGPKPAVCFFKNGRLSFKFKSVVTKGVMAVAISPQGNRAVCVGMDQDHQIAILDLQQNRVISLAKGGKKLILKVGWVSNNQFVTIGIKHYKYWSFDGALSAKVGQVRNNNLVSLAIGDGLILTGGSKGSITSWKGNSQNNEINLSIKSEKKQEEHLASVVQSLTIQADFVAAGTKDGYIFILDKTSLKTINILNMAELFLISGVKSENPAIRSIDFHAEKMCVGTLGAQIYILEIRNITKDQTAKCTNIVKCHYSPNNTWTNEVWGLHVDGDLVFTCSDDATLRCWSVQDRKLLNCVSLNVGPEGNALEKDKKTRDFSDSAKGRAVYLSIDRKQVIVGSKNGTVRVYTFNSKTFDMKFKTMFRHAKQWISDIKMAYNTLIIGSHDNSIYVYNYEDGKITKKYAPLSKHSSYITHLDVSRDSCFLQSTCGGYELLFWDLNTGKQLTAGASMLRDQRWATWSSNLGWPVQGIYPKCTDGTFINAVDRSHTSVNQTIFKNDSKSHYLLAGGNDSGKVCLYNYPCTIKSSKYVQGAGHSSHVTNVRWTDNDKYIISTGGEDQCLMYWKVKKIS